MSVEVPFAVLDDLIGLAAIRGQLRALEAEREHQAQTCLAAIANLHDDVSRLNALNGFRVTFGKGWSKLAADAGLPSLKALEGRIRGRCNDGEGRWRGAFPLAQQDVRPERGAWVVYQLFLGEELVYIGSTGDFTTRIKAHGYNKDFDWWRASRCNNEADCRTLEAALIDRYRPTLNRMIPRPKVALR